MRIAVGFHNGLGNLLFLSAAIKVLRNWGYDDITLVTDKSSPRRNYDFATTVGAKIFDHVVTEYDETQYDKLFLCGWSVPAATKKHVAKYDREIKTVHWEKAGMHEVQVYLEMIGASWKDFDGYILDVALRPTLEGLKPRIALANPSGSDQAKKKSWDKFLQLSQSLMDMGFDVYLLGYGDELKGCEGMNYVGELTIEESARVLQQCDLLIASSTALTVIADHVKTPVLLLEGPMFTARAHPVMSRYDVVRTFISCAPCFQTGLWKHCTNPQCMTMITVEDVLRKMFSFMPRLRDNAYQWQVGELKYVEEIQELPKVDKKIAYMISCQDRYYLFEHFMQSFLNSNLLPGTVFFWNDGSIDPRVQKLIAEFHVDGIKVKKGETALHVEKSLECKIPSTRVGNLLLDAVCEANKVEKFDYIAYLDSDIIIKPNWAQKLILMYEEIHKRHNVWCISGLNNRIDFFNTKAHDPALYETQYGNYRIRGGSCIHFMMPMHFANNGFGRYDQSSRSSDISKSRELLDKGFRCAISVPSLVQHLGAAASSFRNNVGVIAEDFK